MCGNPYSTTPTVDSADLMAIIHPTPSTTTSTPPTKSTAGNPFQGGRLRLSNRFPGATTSSFKLIRTIRDDDEGSDSDISNDASDTECSNGSDSGACDRDFPTTVAHDEGGEVLHVRIHKYGLPLQPFSLATNPTESLTSDTTHTTNPNPVLHSFPLLLPPSSLNNNTHLSTSTSPSTSTLGLSVGAGVGIGIRLSLTAGGDGVVGRTVSIVDSKARLVGEGVIGWC